MRAAQTGGDVLVSENAYRGTAVGGVARAFGLEELVGELGDVLGAAPGQGGARR